MPFVAQPVRQIIRISEQMKPPLLDRERRQIADDLMTELAKPIEGVRDFKDENEAMDFAIEQIRRYREENSINP
jgi:hypothetical protein